MALNMWKIMLSFLVICELISTIVGASRIECGRRKWKTVYLIRHGNDAIVGQWPWHAAIYHLKGTELKYECGGSILDHNTILTAAHCVSGVHGVIQRRNISVQLGRTELNQAQGYIQSLDVREIIIHPKFTRDSVAHDIALIKLYDSITMSKDIQPVCIWNLGEQESIIGKNGSIVGFGLNENDTVSDHLKYANISIVEPLECIASDRGVFGSLLSNEMICGKGHNGVSACNGDSGGGMFFEINGKWFVRGIVSFTPGRENNRDLCDGIKNTVFTDVKKYVGWITQHIDERVLHDENEVIVDYDEKLKMFNFETCGSKVQSYFLFVGFVQKLSHNENDNICFATAINNWYAASPAHCFQTRRDRYEIKFLEGSKQIQRVIIHPKFDSTTFANDIALIELMHSIENDPNIIPICLPVIPEMRVKTFDSIYLADHFDNIAVTYINNSECTAQHTLVQQSSQFCVEIEDETSLFYESLPLYQQRTRRGKDQLFLQGFQSLRMTQRNTSSTLVIDDINIYMDWILYNMKNKNLEDDISDEFSSQNYSLTLTRKPDERLLETFMADNCGVQNADSDRYPWIGWLHANHNISIVGLKKNAIATLINIRFALAAAVIMGNSTQWRFITFGAISSYYECENYKCDDFIQEVEIREISIHPNYTISPRRNDIALLEVWPEIDRNHLYIRPICLPWMEESRKSQTLRLTVSTTIYFLLQEKLVERIDMANCQQRFFANGYQVGEENISICTIYLDGEKPTAIVPGAPLQAEKLVNGTRQYFLGGLSYDIMDGETMNNVYIPLLFTDTNSHLNWILEEVNRVFSVNFRMIDDALSQGEHLKPDQVTLSPIRSPKKSELFDFNTCAASKYESDDTFIPDPFPWLGIMDSTNNGAKQPKCAVILISDRYGISTASCAVNFSGEVTFYDDGSIHRFPIQRVIVHPAYQSEDLSNNIALLELEKPASSLHKICLPIMDEARTLGYKRSRLRTYVSYKPFSINSGHILYISSNVDRYVDSVYCQIYRNESMPKHERIQSKPMNLSSTMCIHYNDFGLGLEVQFEGSPMFSLDNFNGVYRYFLRGISLKSGTMAPNAFIFYLEIDAFFEWILDNMNNTMAHNELSFDLKNTLIFSP